ncbi:hypothetical protein ACFQ10_19180 [Streptomyces indonesiensis]
MVVFVPHRLLTEQTSAVRAADHRPVVVEPVVVGKVNQDAGGAGLGPAAADPAGGRLLNGVSVDDIPDLPDVPDAPASPGTGLPRRRNRRRPASGAAPASRASSTDVAGGADGTDGTDGTDGPDAVDATDATDAVDLTTAPARAAPTPPPAAAPWTPEAARASITSVVSGTRRGRVEAEAEAVPPDDESSPDREDREGGR